MPELLEVEFYRRTADRAVGGTIVDVKTPDAWYIKGGPSGEILRTALLNQKIEGTRRKGKLLLLDLVGGSVLGLRFGMTGRLLFGDDEPIEQLRYSSARNDPGFVRFAMSIEAREGEVADLVMSDPRRLGGVELNPDEARIGSDAMTLSYDETVTALSGGRGPLEARLLDQKRVGGLGNMLVDEILWRCGIDPARAAGHLADDEVQDLHRTILQVVHELDKAGGSHMGTLDREPGERCARDGAELQVRTIGGRTTYSCPEHQS